MNAHGNGFSLVELLVALTLTTGVMAVVFTLITPSGPALAAQSEAVDMQQRLRVGVVSLFRDLSAAGAGGFPLGEVQGLTRVLAPLRPEWLPDATPGTFRPDAVTLLFVPPAAAQATTATALPASTGTVAIAGGSVCTMSAPTCGFSERTRVIVYDAAGYHDLFTVASVSGAYLHLRHDMPDSPHVYPPGSAVVEVTSRAYAVRRDQATGIDQLVQSIDGSVAPVVDHVVALSFGYMGDPEPPRLRAPQTGPDRPATTYGPPPPPPGVQDGGYPPGENCVFSYTNGHVPRLERLGFGGESLVTLGEARLTDGPWCPDPLHPGRFDADLLRIRRVQVRVRVQAAVDALRGPAGALFRHGGTARHVDRMVPDFEAAFHVAPVNLRAQN